MNQRNTIDLTNKSLPNLKLDTPLERIMKVSKNLVIAIEVGDRTPIHNNIEFMRLALRDYDLLRFGEAELPF